MKKYTLDPNSKEFIPFSRVTVNKPNSYSNSYPIFFQEAEAEAEAEAKSCIPPAKYCYRAEDRTGYQLFVIDFNMRYNRLPPIGAWNYLPTDIRQRYNYMAYSYNISYIIV